MTSQIASYEALITPGSHDFVTAKYVEDNHSFWTRNGTTLHPDILTDKLSLGIDTAAQLTHFHVADALPALSMWSNTATGSGSTDGMAIGVTATSRGLIRSANRLDITVNGEIRGSFLTNGKSKFTNEMEIKRTGINDDCYFSVRNTDAAINQEWNFGLQTGGGGLFAIRDITSDNIPFYILPGAPDNSLNIDDTGAIGIGINIFDDTEILRISCLNKWVYYTDTNGDDKTYRYSFEQSPLPKGSPALVQQVQIVAGTEDAPGFVWRAYDDFDILMLNNWGDLMQIDGTLRSFNAYNDGTIKNVVASYSHAFQHDYINNEFQGWISTTDSADAALVEYNKVRIINGLPDVINFATLSSITAQSNDFDLNDIIDSNIHEAFGILVVALPQFGGTAEGTSMWVLEGTTAVEISLNTNFSSAKNTTTKVLLLIL